MPGADQERLARILDEYLVAIERGTPIKPDELLEKYPDDAAQLRGYLSGLQLFHAAAGVSPELVRESFTGAGMLHPAQTIGDYQLVREIGRGGMGVVYEAWQLSLRRRVALKILPFSVAHDAKQLSRFKNEAQAAAQVQHPNIVPVYAVGEENGVHFYVMQLIDGQSLTSVLDGLRTGGRDPHDATVPNHRNATLLQPLPPLVKERAKPQAALSNAIEPQAPAHIMPMRASETADHIRVVARFAHQAAEALHAAHEYGIVHRDVKPSNLLVDDQGKLWVTDFGLARCRETQGLTQTGDVLGTMRYMSPEQALGRAALIDHRTDVYSLGITIYELATLHHPADDVGDLQVYFDRHHEAPKPLRHWNRHIPCDFQTIVLKCVAEFPHERYGTAKELADDFERFLDGRPITASPPSLLSRAGKWAKRRRGVVYATAAVLLIALVGTITSVMVISHEKAAGQERALLQARDHLRQTHALLDRFATQLVDQLAAIPGAEGVRRELLEDCLDLYNRFQREAANDPSLAADLALAYGKLGTLSEKMRKTDQALDAHAKARDVWQKLLVQNPSNAEYTRNLALCENNIGLLTAESGRAAEGLALLRTACKSQTKLLASDPDSVDLSNDLATTHSNLGLVLSQMGAKAVALEEFAAAISIQERLAASSLASDAVMRTLAASYNNFGSLQNDSNSKLAGDAYQKAIAIQCKLVKADPINRVHQAELARTYNNLGFLSSRAKDWKNAELCYSNAIGLQEELVKASPLLGAYRRDLAISYNNLGMAQTRDGQSAQAETSFRMAAQLQTALLAVQSDDAETLSNQGSVWNNLGMLFDRQRRFADAEKAYREAIGNQRHALATAPTNDRYRALLSQHFVNFARNLNGRAKYDAAVEIALERKKLWPAKANRLYSVAQQLAATYGLIRASSAPQPSQTACLRAAVSALRESFAAGLPATRLKDPSFASLAGSDEFRKLLEDTTTTTAAPNAAHQTSLSGAK